MTRINFLHLYKKLKLVPKSTNKDGVGRGRSKEATGGDGRLNRALFEEDFSQRFFRQSNIFSADCLTASSSSPKSFGQSSGKSSGLKNANTKAGPSLPVHVYHDFADRYLVQNIRSPQIPLPINIIENEMQEAFQTRFQEYVYQMAKKNFKES